MDAPAPRPPADPRAAPPPRSAAGPLAQIGVLAIGVYKVTLSPALALFGVRCRHAPGCSTYAAEALRRHGALKGGVLAVSRLARCHPWGSHGYDPVPERLPDAGWRLWRYGDWAWTERGAAACEPAAALNPPAHSAKP